MSKMGVSTYMSYCGAQLFEAIGLEKTFVEKYFRGTASQVGGIGVFEVAEEALRMHAAAFGNDPVLAHMLDAGGEYAWRVRGEEHMWTPRRDRQAAAQRARQPLGHLQGIRADHQRPEPAPHDAARPVRVQGRPGARRSRSTRSSRRPRSSSASPPARCRLGSISTEAHATLAVAMNRIGGKSNTGEGGEDPARYRNELKGIKVTAGTKVGDIVGHKVIAVDYTLRTATACAARSSRSPAGRFGVTTEYLVSADQIQIKMAQGASNKGSGHVILAWLS